VTSRWTAVRSPRDPSGHNLPLRRRYELLQSGRSPLCSVASAHLPPDPRPQRITYFFGGDGATATLWYALIHQSPWSFTKTMRSLVRTAPSGIAVKPPGRVA
jgi:hypothetical protein